MPTRNANLTLEVVEAAIPLAIIEGFNMPISKMNSFQPKISSTSCSLGTNHREQVIEEILDNRIITNNNNVGSISNIVNKMEMKGSCCCVNSAHSSFSS